MIGVPRRPPHRVIGRRAAPLTQIEALARRCPLCDAKPREWCVRVARHGLVSQERGEIPYPVKVKKLHQERFQIEEEEDES